MYREIREWLHLILLYGFLYICAIGILIVFIANIPKNTPQPLYYAVKTPEPVIQKDSSEESLRVVEICSRIDGCPIVNGICETCEIVKE